MGNSPEIISLRKELQKVGALPADPEPEVHAHGGAQARREAAMRQALRSPVIRGALALSLLGGGGWVVDAPGQVTGFIGRAAHRAALTPEEFERALENSASYRAEQHRSAERDRQLEELVEQWKAMAQQVKYLYDAELRRQGREDALREERRNR
jgi:hypothetical protein